MTENIVNFLSATLVCWLVYKFAKWTAPEEEEQAVTDDYGFENIYERDSLVRTIPALDGEWYHQRKKCGE